MHWSVIKKLGRPGTMFGVPNARYAPSNLPSKIAPDQIAEITAQEQALLPGANV